MADKITFDDLIPEEPKDVVNRSKASNVKFDDLIPAKEQSYGAGILDRLTDGLALGWGEELTAAEAALLGREIGAGAGDGKNGNFGEKGWWGGMGDRYRAALSAERAQSRKFKEENPKASFAAELAGGVAGPLGLANRGVTLMRSGLSTPAMIGAGTVEGLAYGGAAGAGFNDDNRLTGAAQGAVIGGALGGAIPAIAGGVNRIRRGATGRADTMIREGLEQDGRTSQTALSALDEMGPDAMPMDLGGNVRGTAEGLHSIPGRPRTMIGDALYTRDRGSNARINRTVDAALGPAPLPSQVQAANKQSAQAISPQYEASLKGARAVNTAPLAESLEQVAVAERGPAQKAALAVRKMLNVYGADAVDPNPKTLLSTRNAIDGLLSNEADPNVIRVLTAARQSVDDELARKVPGLKQVDAQRRELFRQSDGFDEGQSIFAQGKTAQRPQEFADTFSKAGLPEGQFIGPSGKAFTMRQGARAEIDRIIGTNADDKAALRRLIKSDGDWNRQKLATLFGEDKADAVMRVVDNEYTFAQTKNAVTGGSPTAPRAERIRQLSGESTGERMPDNLMEIPVWAARNAAGRVGKAFNAPGIERRNTELARILTDRAEFERSLQRSDPISRRGQVGYVPQLAAPTGAGVGGANLEFKGPLELTVRPSDRRLK